MREKRFGALSSSTDPDKLANTVRGGILAASGLVIYFATQFFGVHLTVEDLTVLATQLGTLAGALWATYGLIQKLVVKFAER